MEAGKLNAQVRSTTGSSAVRKLRAQGKIPAICYGAGVDPVALVLDPSELIKALDPQKGQNTLLYMNIEGETKAVPVMLKDVQRDKLRGGLTHADFIRVNTDQPVRVTVPIVLNGKPEGVKNGGTLHQVYRSLTMLCVPAKIPTKVEIDVSHLGMGQALHVSDLKLGDGMTAALAPTSTLCVVTAPKAEKAAEAAEGAEGAAAAEAGEAKKDDKAAKAPAAKAPAAGGAKAPAKAPAKGAK